MSKPVIAVVVGTLLALVIAALYAPTVAWVRIDPDHPGYEKQMQWFRQIDQTAMTNGDSGGREARWREHGGDWILNQRTWPLRFEWAWGRTSVWDGARHDEDRVRWGWLAAIHGGVLLLGGGLLTVVVRRERRRKAAA